MVEKRVVDSNMDGFSRFSSNFLLSWILKWGDVGLKVFVQNAVFVNCTGDMTIVFFYSIFQTSAGFSCVRKVAIFFWIGPFVDYICFRCGGILSLGCIGIDLRVLAPLKMTCTLIY